MFTDRRDAGKRLAKELERFAGSDAIVLALPRGGVVPGFEIAEALHVPLDIIAVRKIGHPTAPEYAIGAVDEEGRELFNETEKAVVDQEWLRKETARERAEAQRRGRVYRGKRKALSCSGKTAIIVDDGIATGLTMRLAVRSVKAMGAEKIVVAVPVAPPGVLGELRREGADELVVLERPEDFLGAIGAHYVRFDQLMDEEVIHLLEDASRL